MKNYDEIFLNKWRNDKLYRLSLYILTIGSVIFGLLFITYILVYQTKDGKSPRTQTYESCFNGEITYLRKSKGDVVVKINNTEKKIFLVHSYSKDIESLSLYEFLETGDSICKKSFSDSLIITRNSTEYVFVLGFIPRYPPR
jgi:hypothetical protein